MTREEAKSLAYDEDACCQGRVDIDKLIDNIFDNLESQICANCVYYTDIGSCDNQDSMMFDNLSWDDYGCNKFTRN